MSLCKIIGLCADRRYILYFYDAMLSVYINDEGLTLSYHCYTLCGNGALW